MATVASINQALIFLYEDCSFRGFKLLYLCLMNARGNTDKYYEVAKDVMAVFIFHFCRRAVD